MHIEHLTVGNEKIYAANFRPVDSALHQPSEKDRGKGKKETNGMRKMMKGNKRMRVKGQ